MIVDRVNGDYPLVTIVTATYNEFGRISETINSVIMQDYPNIEYIITDDGSAFFPREEIEKNLIKGKFNFQIIEHEENHGTVKNLNNAYKKASGIYIFNLSCGDIFFEKCTVSKIVNELIKRGCDMLATSRLLYEGDFNPICCLPHFSERKIIEQWNTSQKQYQAFVSEMFYDMASGSALYFTKDVLQKFEFYDEKYTLWEDGPFLEKYLKKGKLEVAYDIISIWYQAGGVSSEKNGKLNPKMKTDIILYNNTDRISEIHQMNYFVKRCIMYRKAKIKENNKIRILLIDIFYLPEMIKYIIYTHKRKRSSLLDLREIKRLESINNVL